MAHQSDGLLSPWLTRRRLAAVDPYLGRGRLLDCGCGVGELAGRVSAQRYLGFDADLESIRIARRRFPAHRFFVTRESFALGATERFETIVALAVIEHVADPELWLVRVHERLARNGRLVLTTPHPAFRWAHELGARLGIFSREGARDHQEFLGRARLIEITGCVGLRVVTFQRFLGGANQLLVLESAAGSSEKEAAGAGSVA